MTISQKDPVPFSDPLRDYQGGHSHASDDAGPDGGRLASLIGQGPDIRSIISAFRRRLRVFGGIVLAVFLAALVFTIESTPKYSATTDVMLDTRKQNVSKVEDVLSDLPPDSSIMDTEVEILKSRQLAERVLTKLHLDEDPEFNSALQKPNPVMAVVSGVAHLIKSGAPDAARGETGEVAALRAHEKIVDAVIKGLAVKRAGLTWVINISYTAKTPVKAATIANTFADFYLLEQLEAKFDATKQANTWLSDRLGELKGQVQTAEAAVEQYKTANNLLSSDGATLTEQEISNENLSVAQARTQQAEVEAKLHTAQTQLANGSNGEDVGAALDSPVIQQLRSQRAGASSKVADLSGRYGAQHPEMLKAQRELKDIDGQIQAETNRIISNLQAQVSVARQRTASIEGSLGGAKGTLAQNNKASVHLHELERNADAVRTLYEGFLSRFQETNSQQSIGTSDARIVSRAELSTSQSSPKVMMYLALGVVLGIGLGALVVILMEMFDTGVTTADDVEQRLDVVHLGSLPLLSSVADQKKIAPIDFVIKKPLSSFAESFRALRTSIRFSRLGEKVQTILVTSALPGEGKTTSTLCFGRVAAQSGDRVVIVDCDLRRRSVNRLIGIEPEVGLLEVLSGQASLEQVLIKDAESGAYILPLAKSPFTPKDVFGTPAMDRLLTELRLRFDVILLDTAPTLAVADTRSLAAKVDAVVFLVRWRKTPRKAIEASLRSLSGTGAHIAGVALTLVNMKEQSRSGYGDPGYYYSNYSKYYTS